MTQPTGTKTAAERAAESNVAGTAAEAAQVERLGQRPIVYKAGKRGKKRKYSRALKEPERQERAASRAAERLAQSLADGFGEYRKRRDRSADKKRDGAVKDAVRNVGRGLEEAIRKSAKAPTDLSRRLSLRRLRRMVVLPPPFGFLR